MTDYNIGYGKPPSQYKFEKGTCPNKLGRGKAKAFEAGLIFEQVMELRTTITKRGKAIVVPLEEFSVRSCAAHAVKGDLGAAEMLIDMLNHSIANRDFQRQTVFVSPAQCRALGISAKRWSQP